MKYSTYCLYDNETNEFVEWTDEPIYENCIWRSLSFITEDWTIDEWNRAFSEFETAEDMLNNINYEIKQR